MLQFAFIFKDAKMFLYHYLRNPKATGAIMQSSKYLAQIITQNINLENADNIIELGPGMGAFTKIILKKKKESARFFAIEINPKLACKLSAKHANIDIALGSAQELCEMMSARGMDSADAIISGIPFAFLSVREQSAMLKNVHSALKIGGYFSTFAYHTPLVSARTFRKMLYRTFARVETSKSVLLNIPPAFVYVCQK